MTNIYVNSQITGRDTGPATVTDENGVGAFLDGREPYNVVVFPVGREKTPTYVKTLGADVGESVARRARNNALDMVVVLPEGMEPTRVKPVIQKGPRFTI